MFSLKGFLEKTVLVFSFSLLANLAGVGIQRASADVRPFDVWRSNQTTGHYFRHDYKNKIWVETINCRRSFIFTLFEQHADSIVLYDSTRNKRVLLDQKRMFIFNEATQRWDFYETGRFDPRYLFQHVDANGGNVGFISIQDNCQWNEIPTGFVFRESNVQIDQVILYDPARDMYAQLGERAISLRVGPIGTFNFFRRGSWE